LPTRAHLLFLAVVALPLALSATAAAGLYDVPPEFPTHTRVRVAPFIGPLVPGEARHTEARVDYCFFAAGAVAPGATVVSFRVTGVPDGATVDLAPTFLTFRPDLDRLGSSACAPPGRVRLSVTLPEPPEEPVLVRLVAEAEANPPLAPSAGEDVLIVTWGRAFENGPAPAPAEAAGATVPVVDEAPDERAVIAALGSAGALVGLALARARER